MSTDLMTLPQSSTLTPLMTIEAAVARRQSLVEFCQKIMVEGVDYGAVPGTGGKPTLFKPGAEKLTTFFQLHPTFEVVREVEDWTGVDHGGEPFFSYWFRCKLWNGETQICEADGSCNSWESKHRYRKSERTCPECNTPAIIKGKEQYGGGWICFAKKGGCGAKFKAGDEAIESQQVGRVVNPDIFDIVNTIQKMAQKRALVAATLLGVNASEFFTQDIEDIVEATIVDTTTGEVADAPKAKPVNKGRADCIADIKRLATQIGAQTYREQFGTRPDFDNATDSDLVSLRGRLQAFAATSVEPRPEDEVSE